MIVKTSVHRNMPSRAEIPKATLMPITAALLREALLADVEAVVGTAEGGGEGTDKVVERDREGKEPEEGADKVEERDGEGKVFKVGADKVVVSEGEGMELEEGADKVAESDGEGKIPKEGAAKVVERDGEGNAPAGHYTQHSHQRICLSLWFLS